MLSEAFHKKIKRKYSMVFRGHLSSNMCRSSMKGKPIRRSMNDSYQISNVDTVSLICRRIHFLSAYRHLQLSKYVEVVVVIDSKKSIYPYWYEEKILAKSLLYLSICHDYFLKSSPSHEKKHRLSKVYSKISRNGSNFSQG